MGHGCSGSLAEHCSGSGAWPGQVGWSPLRLCRAGLWVLTDRHLMPQLLGTVSSGEHRGLGHRALPCRSTGQEGKSQLAAAFQTRLWL